MPRRPIGEPAPEDALQQRLREQPNDYWRTLLSFERSSRATGLKDGTLKAYRQGLISFGDFLAEQAYPTELRTIKRQHIEEYFIAQRARTSRTGTPLAATTLDCYHRSLVRFFHWWLEDEEDERLQSPMAKVKAPKIPQNPVPIVTEEQLKALFKATEGADFHQKRNRAILLLLMDTGVRRSELVGIKADDVDWKGSRVLVTGKNDKARWVPFGRKTLAALDRYDRERAKWIIERRKWDLAFDSGYLFLGRKGRLTPGGLNQVIDIITKQAGVPHIHPHQFRHTFASNWLEGGGNESDLEEIVGWTNATEMLKRYGRSARSERARKAHKNNSPADKLL